MVSVLLHTPRVLVRYLLGGENGLSRVERRLHEAAHEKPERKFSKKQAMYLPQSPFPPVFWRNECERCRFWQDGEPGEPGRCHIVGRSDDPFGGDAIHPRGWCGLYMPPADEPAFEWISERLDPTGATSVRGQYRRPLEASDVESETREQEVPVTEASTDGGE